MSHRLWSRNQANVARNTAVPLSRHRPRQSYTTEQRRHRTQQTGRLNSHHASSVASYVIPVERIEEARIQYRENVAKACTAAKKQEERERLRNQTKLRSESANVHRVASRVNQDVFYANKGPEAPTRSTQFSQSTPQRDEKPPVSVKRHKPDVLSEPVVAWKSKQWPKSPLKETLVERALREGDGVRVVTDHRMIKDGIQNGLAILGDAEGLRFETNGLDLNPWTKVEKWKELVGEIVVEEDDDKNVDVFTCDGKKLETVGNGTFNVVITYPRNEVPESIPEHVVWRVTRPDVNREGKLKYQTFEVANTEVANAIFSSQNKIGVPLYGVAAIEVRQPRHTVRYGLVMAMKRASHSLVASFKSMQCEKQGWEAAEKMIDLTFRASRAGVLFTDIKPGNVLEFPDTASGVEYRLTDYDPAFFMITDKEWPSLLLLNLAMLSAHVHNSKIGLASRGWARAVGPLLRQLVSNAHMYDSSWLFLVRCVGVSPRMLQINETHDFALQKSIAVIWTCYFKKRSPPTERSDVFGWTNCDKNQCELNKHWKSHPNSWPPSWSEADDKPLIEQLVELALVDE